MRKLAGMAGVIAAAAMAMSPAMTIVARNDDEERAEQKQDRAPVPQRIGLTRGASRLNRSRHWEYAATYKEARAISPFPGRPIR